MFVVIFLNVFDDFFVNARLNLKIFDKILNEFSVVVLDFHDCFFKQLLVRKQWELQQH